MTAQDGLPSPQRGKAVLVHTGWARHWRTDAYFEDHPFLTEAAAAFLVQAGAALVGIDADRYHGERERARRELALKKEELDAARTAVARRRSDGDLEISNLQTDLDYATAVISMAEQRAERSGVVTFYFNAWTGQRYEEGSSTNSGQAIGELVRPGALGVRAYALEPDRRGLRVGQPVQLQFDAIRGESLTGRITAIGGTPQAKAEWGSGRYFVVDVSLPEEHALPLRPGMSVRVSAVPGQAPAEAEAAP